MAKGVAKLILFRHKEDLQKCAELLLSDPSVLVRMKAAFALSRMGRLAKGAVPVLIKALDDEDVFVRRNALFALKKIGTPKAREALEAFRKQEQLRTPE